MRCIPLILFLVPALLTGCTAQKRMIAEQAQTIDSLYVLERNMRQELYALQDSILFYDEIDSGLYYRQQRALEDRINRLEYLLVSRQDSLCAPEIIETLQVDDLFESSSAVLSEAGMEILDTLAVHLDTTYTRHRFRVEGHSDSVPLGATLLEKYPSNWELSAARAAAVVRYLTETAGFAPSQFEVAAFGDARPIASNNTARGRRSNRRIRILVLLE